MCLYDAEKQVIIKPFYFVKDAGGVIGFDEAACSVVILEKPGA